MDIYYIGIVIHKLLIAHVLLKNTDASADHADRQNKMAEFS